MTRKFLLAALVIRSMLGGKSGYELEFSTKNIVVGETATATLKGVDSNAAEQRFSGPAVRTTWSPWRARGWSVP